MKCPHCGMNIRDNIAECGYCGGKITKESDTSLPGAGKKNNPDTSTGHKGAGAKIPARSQEEPETDEEEGGISVYLQQGEQVLIGSLNIAVKKFFFHAYLTNQRVFLIDTQEKKVKVTAKDIPRDTIAGSIVEYSESSDPVLVLSLKSADDELKTMKLIFIQNGLDRSDEIDEWITLLQEPARQKKIPAKTIEEHPEPREEPAPVQPEKHLPKQEMQPKKKPGRDHEKQPPVKRHIQFHKIEEPKPEVEEPRPTRRAQVREVPEPVRKPVSIQEPDYEFSPVRKTDAPAVRKYEVQSAMKVAMKSAMQPLKPSSLQTPKRPVIEPLSPPIREREPENEEISPKYSTVREKSPETPAQGESSEIPPFCQNCGKKIPPAANFCPGCGTKLGPNKAVSPDQMSESSPAKKATHHDLPVREKKGAPKKEDTDEDEKDEGTPVPTKPPVKKGPKGSEMTILHKFLRR
jgi:hypothetical protein